MRSYSAINVTLAAWLFVASTGEMVAAGELGQLRAGVAGTGRSSSSPPPAPSSESDSCRSNHRSSWGDDSDDEGFLDGILGGIFVGVVTSPWTVPHLVFDEPGSDRFTGYNETYDTTFEHTDWFCRSTDFISSARAQLEYGTDFNDMQTVGTRIQVDFARLRSTLDISWNNYYEQLATDNTDHLAIGDANLVVRFSQSERTVWRSGLGINWINDRRDDIGFNFTYGFDLLPKDPWVWSSEIDLGTLGDANLFRARTTLGAQWHDGEIYTGFEYLDVADAQIPTMLFGARYWW